MNANFFDAIYIKDSLSNPVEDLFFWEGISEKLGYRKFTCLGKNLTPIKDTAVNWLKTAIKILLCATLIIPLYALAAKACFRWWLGKVSVNPTSIMNQALEGLKLQIKSDINQGKIVLMPEVVKEQYKEVLSLLNQYPQGESYIKAYNSILNHEMVKAELKKRANGQKETRLQMERLLLESLKISTREESVQREIAIQAEQNLLLNLLKDGDPEELGVFKEKIYRSLLIQRISSQGVDNAEKLADAVLFLEKWYSERLKELEQIKFPWDEQLLRVQRERYLQNGITSFLNKKGIDGVYELKRKKGSVTEGFRKKINESFAEEQAFYEKFGPYIEKKFVQGFNDEQDIFGRGTCLATSFRWGLNEQKNPQWNAEEIIESGKVLPNDRFKQALYVAAQSKAGMKKSWEDTYEYLLHHPVDKLQLNKCFGIKEIECIAIIEDMKQLEAVFKKINADSSNGVMLALIPGHQIYIRFDPKKPIYRIGDPNVGILKFPDEAIFIDCLRTMMKVFHESNNFLNCYKIVL